MKDSIDKLDFERSAHIIGEEMGKYRENGATNFGFLTKNNVDYRISMGGNIENLEKGIAIGISEILRQLQSEEEMEEFMDDLYNDTFAIVEHESRKPIQ